MEKIPNYTIALLKKQIVIRNTIIENTKNIEMIKECECEIADMKTALEKLEGGFHEK